MNKEFEREKENDFTELVEEVLTFDDLEMDNDIREWLQTPHVQLKDYRFGKPDSEEEYYALLDELSEILMER